MNYLKEMDLYGDEFKLKRKRSPKFKTVWGGAVSLLTIALILAAVIYFARKFFSREDSTTVINIAEAKDQYVDFSKIPIMMRLSDSAQVPHKEWYKIWNITHKFMIGGVNITDPQKKIIQLRIDIPMEPCDLNKHFGEWKSYFENLPDINTFLCANYKNISYPISGVYGDIDGQFKYFNYYIHRCQKNCYNSSIIEKYLQSVYLDTATIDYTTKSLSLVPFEPHLRSDRHTISSSVYIRIWMSLQTVLFRSDIGYIFEDFREDLYYQFDRFYKDVDVRDQSTATVPGTYCVLTLSNISSKVIYTRTFIKAQNVLANIGGILKTLIVFGQIVYLFLFRKLYDMELISFLNFKQTNLLENLKLTSTSHRIAKSPKKTTLHHIIDVRKKQEKINLNYFEYVIPYSCIKNKNKLKSFEKSFEYVDSLVDIKNFIRNQEDFFKLRYLILDSHQNHLLTSLPIKLGFYNKERVKKFTNEELIESYEKLVEKNDKMTDIDCRFKSYFEENII